MRRDQGRLGASGRKTKRLRVTKRLALGRTDQERPRGSRDSPRESAGGEDERAKPGGGGRRPSRCRPFDPPRLPLIRSAFGDTGTKAVHHITARRGGSLRSRRLIRGERVGRRGGKEADPEAGARAPRSDPRRWEGAGPRARPCRDSEQRGRRTYFRASLNKQASPGFTAGSVRLAAFRFLATAPPKALSFGMESAQATIPTPWLRTPQTGG